MKIKLVKLDYSMESKVMNFISESSDLPDIFKLIDNDFKKTVIELENYSKGINLPDKFIKYTNLYALDIDTDNIIGQISVRHELNDFLKFRGGHIGYYVCPNQRNNGFGTNMLKEVTKFCKEININKILITCDESNIGSNKVILNNGGVLESKDTDSNGVVFNRYWIDIL